MQVLIWKNVPKSDLFVSDKVSCSVPVTVHNLNVSKAGTYCTSCSGTEKVTKLKEEGNLESNFRTKDCTDHTY